MGLENRVAAIMGAAGGLGRVVSRALAEQGARLALFGTNAERLNELARELRLPDDSVLTGALDLADPEAARRSAAAVLDQFGRVDILLHLVGGWAGGTPVADLAAHVVDDMLQQHLWTTLHVAQAFVAPLKANGWGRIIVVSSPSAANPPAKGAPYSIGKAAQEALILTLAEELKGTGVTANVLRVRAIDAQHERDRDRSPRTAAWTTPEEIAAAILYLCSDEARMVNGARIPLYGSP